MKRFVGEFAFNIHNAIDVFCFNLNESYFSYPAFELISVLVHTLIIHVINEKLLIEK